MDQKIEVTEQTKPVVDKKLPKKAPIKHSNFFCTINSQKNMNSMSTEEQEPFISKFRSVIQELFNSKIKELIILQGSKIGERHGLPRDCSLEELETRIEKINIEFVVEIGPESGKLHAHALVAITKRAVDTKLDYSGIRKWLEEKLGFPAYFNSVLYRDAKANLQDYIRKNPTI